VEGGTIKKKEKIEKGGGAGASHIYAHNFVVRYLLIEIKNKKIKL
jgi:hypothetical protein